MFCPTLLGAWHEGTGRLLFIHTFITKTSLNSPTRDIEGIHGKFLDVLKQVAQAQFQRQRFHRRRFAL
jgi:hypothetical protein